MTFLCEPDESVEQQSTLTALELERAKVAHLRQALQKLKNEANALLAAHEEAIGWDSGYSSISCLKLRIEAAEHALSATSEYETCRTAPVTRVTVPGHPDGVDMPNGPGPQKASDEAGLTGRRVSMEAMPSEAAGAGRLSGGFSDDWDECQGLEGLK